MVSFELLSPGKRLPPDYWTSMAPGTERTEIEIGPGDGKFLVEAAHRDNRSVFVGLEVRIGLARKLMERTDLPPNVRVHHGDARWIVEHLVADDSVETFHIYFPDPWWKKRHHKRRLLDDASIRALARCLKPAGAVQLVSDVEGLFSDAAQGFEAAGLKQEAWRRNEDDPAQSSYERKYRRQGRHLFQARFVKT